MFYRATGQRPGDHRDWAAIEGWAAGIAGALAPRGAGSVTG
ncbi:MULTISPECIES: hypothetical protein [unclassified Blastococcus]